MVYGFENAYISLLHYPLSFTFVNILGERGQNLDFKKADLYLHSIWISFYLNKESRFPILKL